MKNKKKQIIKCQSLKIIIIIKLKRLIVCLFFRIWRLKTHVKKINAK